MVSQKGLFPAHHGFPGFLGSVFILGSVKITGSVWFIGGDSLVFPPPKKDSLVFPCLGERNKMTMAHSIILYFRFIGYGSCRPTQVPQKVVRVFGVVSKTIPQLAKNHSSCTVSSCCLKHLVLWGFWLPPPPPQRKKEKKQM